MKRSDTSSRVVRQVVACLAMAALVASCGSDDSSSTADSTGATTSQAATSTADSAADETSSAPSGDVCADREALRDSVAALADVDLVAEGTNGAKSAISAVKDDLAALRTSAGSELEPEVQAVQDAIDELESAVGNLDSGGATQAVTAVSDLVTSSGTLLDSLDAGACGEAAPSTT
jgi:ABC-type enterochelin transport system substrate-binding protein